MDNNFKECHYFHSQLIGLGIGVQKQLHVVQKVRTFERFFQQRFEVYFLTFVPALPCRSHCRQNLSTVSTQAIREVVEELLQSGDDEILAQEYLKANKFACLKCFGLFEKLLRLRGDLHQLQDSLVVKLKDSYDKKAATLSHGRKHPLDHPCDGSHDQPESPPRKRARTTACTPVRQIVRKACSSPTVTVSLAIIVLQRML